MIRTALEAVVNSGTLLLDIPDTNVLKNIYVTSAQSAVQRGVQIPRYDLFIFGSDNYN